jgi:hypothetical protein
MSPLFLARSLSDMHSHTVPIQNQTVMSKFQQYSIDYWKARNYTDFNVEDVRLLTPKSRLSLISLFKACPCRGVPASSASDWLRRS